MNPWTQAVELSWRPELRFYEERGKILRQFDEAEILDEFNWHDQILGARLGPFETVQLTATGISLTLGSPRADTERLRHALSMALLTLKPRDVTLNYFALEYLLPISLDSASAQRVSAQQLAAEMLPDGEPVDWAVLLDGRSERLKTGFQVQFGVVSETEIPARLSRSATSFAIGGRQLNAPADLNGVPECALFLDWTWTFEALLGMDNPLQNLSTIWDQVAEESRRLSEKVQNRYGLSGTSLDNVEVQS